MKTLGTPVPPNLALVREDPFRNPLSPGTLIKPRLLGHDHCICTPFASDPDFLSEILEVHGAKARDANKVASEPHGHQLFGLQSTSSGDRLHVPATNAAPQEATWNPPEVGEIEEQKDVEQQQ